MGNSTIEECPQKSKLPRKMDGSGMSKEEFIKTKVDDTVREHGVEYGQLHLLAELIWLMRDTQDILIGIRRRIGERP